VRCFDADGEQTIKVAPKWVNSSSFHLRVVVYKSCSTHRLQIGKNSLNGGTRTEAGSAAIFKPSGSPGG
jgi:hypothetical protein